MDFFSFVGQNFRFVLGGLSRCFTVPFRLQGILVTMTAGKGAVKKHVARIISANEMQNISFARTASADEVVRQRKGLAEQTKTRYAGSRV
jgi:hypothetical protein